MKKFLSLALALVMSLSLLTVGAGATEYKDLNDKGEIQYEEAVAVLNKLGIITGYEDGSFKPTGALTRGAAAKIIVSLMIGSEAASSLTVAAAPYKDVPVTNTFAAVISYCKTAGYISGYTDGTFRPTASLTGYAFTKMLLGALGYDGKVEGFTGGGWTMNAAKLGNKAGLFNDFSTAFRGNDGVTREGACLLALNTLKATEVEYAGNSVKVTGENINVSVGNNQYSYVYSNNNKISKNIKEGVPTNEGYTLEFGEEHFSDLKLVSTDATDDFGRPSNEWSYKNVKVGTYAKTADYTYTKDADGDTDADQVKDMGIKDYTVAPGVKAVVNGSTISNSTYKDAGKAIKSVTDIPGLLGKGTLVQLYISDKTANQITNVVVIKTQLMQVNAVKSDSVTLKRVEDTGVSVAVINDDDDAYQTLKGLKADDYVLVVPVEDTKNSYIVDSASIPQTVTGKLTKIKTNSKSAVTGITVNGTDYKMSDLWSSEDGELKSTTSLTTNKEATAYMDSYGYAIFVKNVVASNSVIVIDEIYQSLIDGKLIYMAKGWDTNGNELTLNLGTVNPGNLQGVVREYAVTTNNNAEYQLLGVTSNMVKSTATTTYVAAGSTRLLLDGNNTYSSQYFDSNVKFIFLSKDNDDVTGITVKEGVSEVGSADKKYDLQYTLNKEGEKITAVIVPNDNDAAVTANLIYISKVEGTTTLDNKTVSVFTAYIDGVKTEGCIASKNNAGVGFYTYSKNDSTGVYTLSTYSQTHDKTTSVLNRVPVIRTSVIDKTYIPVAADYTNDGLKTLNAKNATVIDLTESGKNYASLKDMVEDNTTNGFTVSMVYNDSTNTGAGTVSYLYVTDRKPVVDQPTVPSGVVNGAAATAATVINADTGAITMNYIAGVETIAAKLNSDLTAAGYTNVIPSVSAGSWTVEAIKDGVKYNFAVNATAWNRVLVGSTVIAYINGSQNAVVDLSKAANGSFTGDGYMIGTSYAAYSASVTIPAGSADVLVKTGYVAAGFNTTATDTIASATTYKVNGNTVAVPTSLAVGDVVTMTITLKAGTQLNAAATFIGAKIGSGAATTGIVYNGAATNTYKVAANVLIFDTLTSATNSVATDTIEITYAAAAAGGLNATTTYTAATIA